MHRPGKVLRGVNLHPVDAVQLGFPHGRAREPGSVYILVLDEAFLKAPGTDVRIVVGGAWIEGFAHYLHSRALHAPGINLIANVHRVIAAARIHIEDCRESRSEVDLGVGERDQRALRLGISSRVDVDVGVDHAGHDRRVGEVDDGCARRSGEPRADFRNAIAPDDHHGIGEHLTGTRVEQPPRANGDHLIVRSEVFSRRLSVSQQRAKSREEQNPEFPVPVHGSFTRFPAQSLVAAREST